MPSNYVLRVRISHNHRADVAMNTEVFTHFTALMW